MDNLAAVEVIEAGEDLAGEIGEGGFVGDAAALEGAAVHVFKEDLNLAGVIEHVVALNHV